MTFDITAGNKIDIHEYLQNPKSLSNLQRVPLQDRIQTVQFCFSKNDLVTLKKLLHFDYDLISNLLMITKRSLHLKKNNDIFNRLVSDKMMTILELYSHGYELMGSGMDFNNWMMKPNERLLGAAPINMIHSHPGLLAVREELLKFRFGQL